LPESFFKEINSYSKEEIAFEIIRPYTGNTIPDQVLENICAETLHFEFPLKYISETVSVLELFHGPTLAFKDVGARFMSRCLGYFLKEEKKVTVLVATSGDTGGAVADAFFGVENIEVVILYPSGKVSQIQELQLTTHGGNVHALEIDGNFDDCQKMVKESFADRELNKQVYLTSANSINIARWLPQQFYYFLAYQQWKEKDKAPVIAVPSGNFGNLCAGVLAWKSGLPVQHFIAACNANDIVPEYFNSGKYQPKPAKHTISNAMDVGDPSNFKRLLELFENEISGMKEMISAVSISDDETREARKKLFAATGYNSDPHGAVAYKALSNYLQQHPGEKGYFLETAHPIKFPDDREENIGAEIPSPESIKNLLHKKKISQKMRADSGELKEWLRGRIKNKEQGTRNEEF
jgi:threonine synthase